jgi:hypothetical protein
MNGVLWIIGPMAVVVVLVVCFTYPRRNHDPIPYAMTTISIKYTVSKVLS